MTEVILRPKIMPATVLVPDSDPAAIIKNDKLEDNILKPEVPNQIRVDLLAEGKSYAITVTPGSTIYDAMVMLAGAGTLEFKATHYIGLGYFVQEINGRKNTGGNYWILYINGLYSAVGVSQYILKEGDKIEWKYEN